MTVTLLEPGDIKPLDDLMIRPDGLLNVVPSWKLHEHPLALRQQWCVQRGIYQYPTEELLNWLSNHIASRDAIEICAGNGVLGRELGIPTTDSYMQTRPEIIAYYRSLGQTPITPPPPPDVLRLDANTAVNQLTPQVVIGAFVTQLYDSEEHAGSVEGVNEIAILQQVTDYVHIGNNKTHGYKKIMRLERTSHHFDWLISRAQVPALNHICVWESPRSAGT